MRSPNRLLFLHNLQIVPRLCAEGVGHVRHGGSRALKDADRLLHDADHRRSGTARNRRLFAEEEAENAAGYLHCLWAAQPESAPA